MNKPLPHLKLLACQWRLLSLGFLLSFVCVTAGIALLVLSGWLITAAAMAGLTTAAGFFNYLLPAAGIRFFALLRIITRYGERVVNHNATFKILRDLRYWCYQKLEPLAPAHFLRYQSGDLLQRLVSDIDDLDNLYLRVLSPFAIVLLLAVPLFIFTYFFSAVLAWLLFCAFIFTTLIAVVMGSWLGQVPGTRVVKQLTCMRTQLVGNLQAAMEMIVFGLRQRCQETFDAEQQRLASAQLALSSRQGLGAALVLLLMGLTLIGVLVIGIPLVQHQHLPVAVLGMLVFLVMAAFEVVMPLPAAFQTLGKTQAAAMRINELVETTPTVIFPAQSTVSSKNFDLCLKKISFKYPGHSQLVLSNISLEIPAGQRIAITGRSGEGKSTLVHLMTRSWDPSRGEILLAGHDLTTYTEAKLRRTISIAQQQTHIFNQSVRRNLLIANPEACDEKLWQILAAVRLKTTVAHCREGLSTEMGEFGNRFSGGQVKRMGLARALLSASPIIILDEPSEGLDDTTYQKIWQSMQPFLENRTVIVITHNRQNFDSLDQVYQLTKNSLIAC